MTFLTKWVLQRSQQLKNECHHVFRMEARIMIPFLKERVLKHQKNVGLTAFNNHLKHQELIMALYSKIKLHNNHFLINLKHSPKEQIVYNDFIHLESMLTDWVYLVRHKIIHPIHSNYSCNESI